MLCVSGNKCYINNSGKYIEINFNMKISFLCIFSCEKNVKRLANHEKFLGL